MSEEMLHSFTDILTEFRALQARVKLVEENNTALEAKVDALSEDLSKVQQLNEAFRSTVAELRTALETDRAEKNKLRSVDGEEKAPADSRSYNQKVYTSTLVVTSGADFLKVWARESFQRASRNWATGL